jgi:hypothetical protein
MATYQLKHRYRPEVIVPYIGISNNALFLIDKDDRYVYTADNVRCLVEDVQYKHIFELTDKIKNDYSIDVLSFLQRWYAMDNNMQSMEMIILKLKKV